jgi:hypothetical protein
MSHKYHILRNCLFWANFNVAQNFNVIFWLKAMLPELLVFDYIIANSSIVIFGE